jgi:hypothetical protein
MNGNQRTSCSISGCDQAADRACPACSRALCQECWCQHEIQAARARNGIDDGDAAAAPLRPTLSSR